MVQGDWRFIAVHNHHLIMPLNIPDCLVQKFGYRVLSNESLPYMSYQYQQYAALSQTYANWYNYEVLAEIETQQPDQFDCRQE